MNNLAGHYELISHGVYSSENVFEETSSYLKGELIYSGEGFLSVQIFFKEDFLTGKDLLAYSGRYKVISNCEVEHHIEICSQSRRNHSVEKRNYIYNNDFLILSILYSDESRFEARWKKFYDFKKF